MAYKTGTASDCFDLYETLIEFLTTDPDLVADAQNWEVVWQPDSNSAGENGTDVVIRGPGLSETDQVYIGMRLETNLLNDSSWVEMVGMTGVIPSALNYDQHVNVTPSGGVRTHWRGNNPMDYWIVANGRRFVLVVQVSTVYESLYGGLFLPYGDPTQYTYPLFIGGTSGNSTGSGEITDWRSTATAHSNFHRSQINTSPSAPHGPSAYMLSPSGEWLTIAITANEAQIVGPSPWEFHDDGSSWRVEKGNGSGQKGYADHHARIIQGFNGDYPMAPISLVQRTPNRCTYGVLEGVYWTPGRGNSAENIVQANGLDHVCFPNVFRTAIDAFWAVQIGFPEDSNSAS